jgi:lipopolysaccharide biosynthesis glycosyltransferase
MAAIPVLLCANGAYFQHMAVTIASLLVNNPARRFDLVIATDRDYPGEQSRLAAMISGFGNATARFIPFGLERIARLPTRLHLTALTYIRLFAAELFDETVDQALYLDSDLVVCGDIGALWAGGTNGRPIAAAPDIFIDSQRDLPARQYVNCGVMLLNLGQWRAEAAGTALIRYIDEHPDLAYLDQDALNAVFAGRIHPLPLRWNFQARMAETKPAQLGMTNAEFRQTRRHPGIVHYTTGSKPWMYRKDVHYTGLYYRYLALTPWRDYRAPDRTLRRRVSKAIRLIAFRRWVKWVIAGAGLSYTP